MMKKEEVLDLALIGKTIAGIPCHKFYQLRDILIVMDDEGNSTVVKLSSLSGKIILHTIEKEEIIDVQVSDNATMFLFSTESKQYLLNHENIVVENSDNWEDSYFDELANSFYRKDVNGYWYDLEGFRMQEVVFLKEDVLISLATKKSKKSLSFRNQEVYISKNKQLIQIGKLLLNLDLEVVKYLGDKITGLGIVNVDFEGEDVMQEIKLGLDRSAFINEYTHDPFIIEEEKIVKHLSTYHYGQKRIEVFQSEKNNYGVIGASQNYISHNDTPLQIVGESHIHIGQAVLIKVNGGREDFYFDLNTDQPFRLSDENIKDVNDIDTNFVLVGNVKMYNVSNGIDRFVIKENDLSLFKLDDDLVQPQRIEDAKYYDESFGFAEVDGKRKLFSKNNERVLRFGIDQLEVSQFNTCPHDKFINALDSNGNNLVLDLRLGIAKMMMAMVDGNKVSEIVSDSMRFESATLVNVFVEKLRGSVKRVVSINKELLTYYTLPDDLVQTSAENLPSVFAGNHYCEINYGAEIAIDSNVFISGSFVAYTGKEFPVILSKESGKPLHLEGNGHRNELASTWQDYTIRKSFYLGANRMVCVNTVTENLKEHQLLFSNEKGASWLPFFDNYLPIMRQIVEIEEKEDVEWNYHLFELGEVSKNKEYLAVEKAAPYRLLTDKKDSGYFPRIIKSKSKSIKSPEELNLLQRIFSLGTGELVEVE